MKVKPYTNLIGIPKEATIDGSTAVARRTAPSRVRYTSHQVAKIAMRAVPKNQADTEREKQGHDGAIRARQQRADAEFFQPPADEADENRNQHQRAPVAGAPTKERESGIAAQHVEIAVREIDDV